MATNTNEREEIKPVAPTEQTKWRDPSLVGKYMVDPKTGLAGLFRSPDNGETWVLTDTVYGHVYNQDEVDNIWDNGAGHKVADEIKSATADLPNVRKQADKAVKFAESAIAASKVNSDAIVVQSEAISEAKTAMDSATAEIQQTAANAASDAAKIRADVARVQSEVDTAKAANSASVEALKSDVSAAKQDLADVHDSLTKAQSAIEQNQKLINDSVTKITSDVSATKQDLANVHDSLTKAQAAAEENQKAIDKSIAQINDSVDATNQDLAGARKDLTKARSDITANQKAIDDSVAQISDDITQDRRDIADVRQGLTKAQSDITANQKVVNDNVAQINSNIEQDRKDIASAQQANANTAKQLDTYSKQAQEQERTIKAVQDKQDGFSIALADVQGNVAQVSDKVDGLSANLKDAQGNVASVKAQADQLSATLTDHDKAIATLTASAKELSSTLEDADGRLSKVEQTAQTNSSTLSDVQGDLSQVKQNATKLVSTLKDAQGNISTLQQKADSVSTQLASAQGDIATLQTGVDSVKATLTSHDKSIHTLQADSKSLKDSMADAQGDISTLSKTATDVTSELEDHTGRLSKVEQSAAKQATTLSDLQGNLSQVEQKADSNTATISSINKNAMQDRGVITDTKTSFDSLTHLGTYSIKAIGLPKMPEQHYGTLAVSGSAGSGWISQQFVADTTGNVYTRVFSNNAWSAWKQGGSQDAINQVKQTADSNSATIRNVQGDVSTLKQTATGIKSTLASHEGDIHTLQADSKSLKDSMTNAQGDISTLQKSATSLDSEMKDHAGRLIKVEQSAATQATTLSDLQGNLTQVKQQADGLVTTLKNAQGSITQIKQQADGTLEQLKSAQGDIASLQTDVTGIKATLVSHEGDIHTLQADSKTLRDDMTDAQGNISSLKKSATDLTSEMSSQDGRLSKVEQTANEHTSTISDLGKKVDSNGGGVNLLTNTQLFDHNWTWDSIGHSFTNGVLTLDGNDNATSRILQQLTDNDTTGKTFSVSFNARISADCDSTSIEVDAGPYDANKRINVTSKEFQHYKAENWQWNSSSIFFSLYVKSGKIDITNLKLEYGAIATPYSLAPGDLATISQVKQTADGIETTLKSTQGDIDQIKQTAKGTSEQLADVKGNVTNIQKDVNGLKQTTADNAGNIHTLQADSKTLKDDMQDAQGDISTLKKTSTDVTAELKDQDGRISKTEQTASTLVNEFADQQGHLNRVEQTAQGTQQTIANQQGQINTIKTDASGIHETLTGQGNQIANINVTLSGLNTKYEGVSGDLGKLSDKVTTNSTQITQNKKEIDLKADQSTVDNLSGEVSQNKAQLKVQADQISSKVSSTDFKTLNDKVKNMKIGGRNLLHNTSDQYRTLTGEGWMGVHTSSDEYTSVANYHGGDQFTYAATINNISDVPVELQVWRCDQNKNRLGPLGTSALVQPGQYSMRVSLTGSMDSSTWYLQSAIYSSSGQSGQHTIQVKDERLVEGNIEGTWEANPADIVASIQKNSTAIDQTNKQISLKADQTEVNQVKGTASENSSRLDTMANEISSKVTATDVNNIVDGKGYATISTVQSLVDQKAGTINESITNLTNEVNTRNGVNLLKGTKDFSGSWHNAGSTNYWHTENWIDPNGNHSVKSDSLSWCGYYQPIYLDTGDYTFSGYYYSEGGKPVYFYVKPNSGDNLVEASYTSNLDSTPNGWRWFVVHFKVAKAGNAAVRLESGQNQVLHIASYKLERGTVTKPVWTPAPSDNATVTQVQQITASIDGLQSRVTNYQNDTSSKYTQLSSLMQSKVSASDFNALKDKATWKSTDSIDLNTAVLQQKIFVKGGSNLPPGDYWWYVQVEPGYDSRIVQYAVSDRDNIHYSRQYDGSKWSAWSQGATESEITQLRDDINLRVKSGDLLSQINLTAGNTLIQSNKLYLDASSVVFSGRAFIPSAAIAELDADKLTFYGNGSKASIGASVAQYDQDAIKSTINLQYQGGFEIHSSNQLGSILTMHDNTVRLAVKSQVYGSGSGQPLNQQYSGVWFGKNYTLMNSVDGNGVTTGISIGTGGSVNGQYRFVLYDDSKSNVSSYGVKINTQRFNVDAGSTTLYMGPTRTEIRANDYTTLHGNDKAWLEGGHAQLYLHDGVVEMHNVVDGSATGLHMTVQGWATFSGYVEAMGWTTKSTLSSKTRIEPLNTADALDKITSTDLTTYQYKDEVSAGSTKRHAGLIIDDVHDVAQYSTPDAFISENRQGRSDADIIGYLMGAVQELKKQLDKVKEQVNNG